jgi:hypothetical protein
LQTDFQERGPTTASVIEELLENKVSFLFVLHA